MRNTTANRTCISFQPYHCVPCESHEGELEKKIEEALAELPENQRTAILLCRQEELSYEEIAEVLGISGITVMREWQKAKAWLYLQLSSK